MNNTARKYIEIDWIEFFDQYMPIQNHLDDNASLDGCMYETYGEELKFVSDTFRIRPDTVWTLIDGDDGSPIILNGYRLVNCIGYLVTAVAEPYCDVTVYEDEVVSM